MEREINNRKHILVIAQYFYPEQFRINDICKEWIKRGYQVTVITGIPNYPQGSYYKGYGLLKKRTEIYEGIHIIRIPLIPRGNNAVMLSLNYLSFVISGFFWHLFTKIHADCVFIYEVSPMTQALPGVWYAKKKKIPCYLYVTDLWPENIESVAGIHNPVVIKLIEKMVCYIYKRCDRIFTSSKSFVSAIADREVPEDKITFWPQYAEDFYLPVEDAEVEEIPKDGVFNIVFAGNIGYAQGLDLLPAVARRLKENGVKVRFNLIGDGRYKSALEGEVRENGLGEYFNFIEKKPPEQISCYMGSADAALISLAKSEVFARTIPAKLQSCMACGRPILLSADGEVQQIIHEAGCGMVSDAGDAVGLEENIIAMNQYSKDKLDHLGDNARKYSEKTFNKESLLDEMDVYVGGRRNV